MCGTTLDLSSWRFFNHWLKFYSHFVSYTILTSIIFVGGYQNQEFERETFTNLANFFLGKSEVYNCEKIPRICRKNNIFWCFREYWCTQSSKTTLSYLAYFAQRIFLCKSMKTKVSIDQREETILQKFNRHFSARKDSLDTQKPPKVFSPTRNIKIFIEKTSKSWWKLPFHF